MAARKASSATRQAKKTSVQKTGKQANGPRASIAGSRRDELVAAILATLPPPQPPRPLTEHDIEFRKFARNVSHLFRSPKWLVDNPAGRDDYPVGLATKLEQIGCQPEDVEGYLQSEKRVLASMYLEAERPHPRTLKLRQLAMQYALDARRPINDDLTRFKWNLTDDRLVITNMNSPMEARKWNELTNEQSKKRADLWEPAVPQPYVPVSWPGVHITDLHSQHVLSLADKSSPSTEIMNWIESQLDKVPTQDDALPLESPSELASQGDVLLQLVTLGQAAAIVNRSKRTLERYKSKMPKPKIKGENGQPDEWEWLVLRPWLAKQFNRELPERFPASPFKG